MAYTDQNLVITPNNGNANAVPQILFSAANNTVNAQNILLSAFPTSNGTLSFSGSSGQLFSITNQLTGTIFSVNDISGIPSIDVQDTGQIRLAPYNGYVSISNNFVFTGNSTFDISSSNGTIFSSYANTGITSIARGGSGSFSTLPTVTISPPTLSGGVQATANAAGVSINTITIASGGANYNVNDILTVTGGIFSSAATLKVTSVGSSNTITGISVTAAGNYWNTLPTTPNSPTGGTGTGASINLTTYYLSGYNILNPGSGYIEPPIVTVSTTGSAPTGIPIVGTSSNNSIIKTVNQNLSLFTPSGEAFRLGDWSALNIYGGQGSSVNYLTAIGTPQSQGPILRSQGTDANINLVAGSKGTGSIQFLTRTDTSTYGFNGWQQFQISDTASAVNYLQATGGVTGAGVTLSAQGSDSAVSLILSAKGGGGNVIKGAGTYFQDLATNSNQFAVVGTSSSINRLQVTGNTTNNPPTISVVGSDTNVSMNLTTQGTGSINLNANTNIYGNLNITGNITSVNYETITYTEVANTLIANTNYINQTYNQGTGVLQANGSAAFVGSILAQDVYVQGGYNSVYYSQDLYQVSQWANNNNIVANTATIAPDGTLTGNKLIANTTNGYHGTSQLNYSFFQGSPTQISTEGNYYTVSIYAKAAEYFQLQLGLTDDLYSGVSVNFNLTAGTFNYVNNIQATWFNTTAAIVPVGNGWYRCSVTSQKVTPTTDNFGSIQIFVLNNSGTSVYAGDNTSGIYLWGAQVEQGSVASPYTPTGANAVITRTSGNLYVGNNVIITGNSTTFGTSLMGSYWNSGTGLLQITGNTATTGTAVAQNISVSGGNNYEYYSQQIGTSPWGISSGISTFTANTSATTAPDGTFTATKLQENTTTSNFYPIVQSQQLPAGIYTWSIYVKAAERTGCYLSFSSQGINAFSYYNLSTGTVLGSGGTIAPPTMTAVGNGWYRCTITIDNPTPGNNEMYHFIATTSGGNTTYAGTVGYGIYIWGSQMEPGYVASPYTVTLNSFATANNNLYVPTGNVYIGGNAPSVNTTSGSLIVNGGAGISGNTYVGGVDSVANTIIRGSGQNLLTYSANLVYNFVSGAGSTITANAAAAPDNSTTAALLAEDSSTGQHWLGDNLGFNTNDNATFTASVYVKAATKSQIILAMSDNTTGNAYVAANLSPALITNVGTGIGGLGVGSWTNISATITPAWPWASSGWYRLTLTATKNAGNFITLQLFNVTGGTSSYTGTAGNGVYFWGPQVEYGTVANPYVTTTGSVIYGSPTLSFASGAANMGLLANGSMYISAAGPTNSNIYLTAANTVTNNLFVSGNLSSLSPSNTFSITTLSGNTSLVVQDGSSNTTPASLTFVGAQTTLGAIRAKSSAALIFESSGTNPIYFNTADSPTSDGINQLQILNTTSAVNYYTLTGGTTGNAPTMAALGNDSTVGMNFVAKNGSINFYTAPSGAASNLALSLTNSGNAVNFLQVSGNTSNSGPVLSAQGANTNIDINITSKGTGNISHYAANSYFYGNVIVTGGMTVAGNTTIENVNITSISVNTTENIVTTGNITTGNVFIKNSITGNTSTITTDTLGNLILSPSANGAIQARAGDGTAANGNIRGANAVDLQTVRNQNYQVASGFASVITGGNNNVANGAFSFVGAGGGTGAYDGNAAGGANSAIVGGQSNLINSNGGWGFIGGGSYNSATAINSTVVGGELNTANGAFSFVGGGGGLGVSDGNAVAAANSAIVGGQANFIKSGSHNFIGGGQGHRIDGIGSSIVGGGNYSYMNSGNIIQGNQSFLGGGFGNQVTNNWSFLGGGYANKAASSTSTVGGGYYNQTNGYADGVFSGLSNYSTSNYGFIGGGSYNQTLVNTNAAIVGGQYNTANGAFSFVGGGGGTVTADGNYAAAANSAVVGGQSNYINAGAQWGSIGGGHNNSVTGVASHIGGGEGNSVSGSYSLIVGGGSLINGGNSVAGANNAIVGGFNNSITSGAAASAILGGSSHIISQYWSGIVSGYNNYINNGGSNAFVGAGAYNTPGNFSVIGGGFQNSALGNASFVGGGSYNNSSGTNAVVGGGQVNTANGAFSFVGGGGGTGAGDGNYAAAANSAVVGGQTNIINAGAQWGFIGGGKINSLGASAQYGVVVGGVNNSASQYLGCVVGGTSNLNYGQYASMVGGFNNQVGFMGFVGGGQYNNAATTNQFGAVVGGYQNNAFGNYTFVGGGYRNFASGIYSAVLGGYQATTRGVTCAQAFGNSPWGSTQGTSQLGTYILSANTNSATANTMTTDWTYPASATNQVILPNNSAYIFKGSVVGTITGGGNTSMWTFEGGIKQGGSAGSTALVGTPIINLIAQDGGASAWSVAITADTTLGALKISVVGDPSATVRWVGRVDTTEVTF